MKKVFFIFLIVLSAAPTFAQKQRLLNEPTHDDRPIHFGFCLGMNIMDFIVHTNRNDSNLRPDVSTPFPGFHIQVITNYRLGEYFDARFLPGISFGQRTLNFFKGDSLYNGNNKLESNYLEFPLLLKYKAKRINNFRPYMITGGNLRVDLAKTFNESEGVFIDLNLLDVFYEIGAGIDFYLPYFKFSTELKFSYGLLNNLKKRNTSTPMYQNSIEKLNSTLVMLSFHFE